MVGGDEKLALGGRRGWSRVRRGGQGGGLLLLFEPIRPVPASLTLGKQLFFPGAGSGRGELEENGYALRLSSAEMIHPF